MEAFFVDVANKVTGRVVTMQPLLTELRSQGQQVLDRFSSPSGHPGLHTYGQSSRSSHETAHLNTEELLIVAQLELARGGRV